MLKYAILVIVLIVAIGEFASRHVAGAVQQVSAPLVANCR